MTSSMLRSSRFSMTVATGRRVPLNTQAPLTFPGLLSTAWHWDSQALPLFRFPVPDHGKRTSRHAGSRCVAKPVDLPQPSLLLVPTRENAAHFFQLRSRGPPLRCPRSLRARLLEFAPPDSSVPGCSRRTQP
jgi:hypothetical protein